MLGALLLSHAPLLQGVYLILTLPQLQVAVVQIILQQAAGVLQRLTPRGKVRLILPQGDQFFRLS